MKAPYSVVCLLGGAAAALLAACSGSQSFLAPGTPLQLRDAVAPHALRAKPSSLSFYGFGHTGTFKVLGGGGTIAVASKNKKVAKVSPSSVSNGKTVTVTPAGGGSTTIALTDQKGHTASVSVKVIP